MNTSKTNYSKRIAQAKENFSKADINKPEEVKQAFTQLKIAITNKKNVTR